MITLSVRAEERGIQGVRTGNTFCTFGSFCLDAGTVFIVTLLGTPLDSLRLGPGVQQSLCTPKLWECWDQPYLGGAVLRFPSISFPEGLLPGTAVARLPGLWCPGTRVGKHMSCSRHLCFCWPTRRGFNLHDLPAWEVCESCQLLQSIWWASSQKVQIKSCCKHSSLPFSASAPAPGLGAERGRKSI